MYDVIVVGARCGGAPTAMLFARRGYRVLLVERARFPRDIRSTLYIHQPGVALLASWGVLDAVRATGCPPIEHAVHQIGNVRLEGCSRPVEGISAAFAPRRHHLDPILVEAAVAAGVEFREGHSVDGLLVDDSGRVIGVRSARGGTADRAVLVVGADGMRSCVAALPGAATLRRDPVLSCVYYTFYAGVPAAFEAYGATGRWVGTVPTADGLTLLAAYFPQAEFPRVRVDPLDHVTAAVRDTAPALYERLQEGEQVGRIVGAGDQENFFRAAAGPGWALVGDAGYHRDSITARGMTDAFRQAELLARTIGDDLHDERTLTAVLRRYDVERFAMHQQEYDDTLSSARLTPLRRARLLRVVAGDAELTERFFSTLAGAPGPTLSLADLRERLAV